MDGKKIQKILQEVKSVREKLKLVNIRPAQRSVSTQISTDKVTIAKSYFYFLNLSAAGECKCWYYQELRCSIARIMENCNNYCHLMAYYEQQLDMLVSLLSYALTILCG